MLVTSWLEFLRRRLFWQRFFKKHPRARRRRSLPISVDAMEQRQLLSATAWVGAATGGDWNSAANWDTGTVPTEFDDVTITANGSMTFTGSVFVNSIDGSGTGDLTFSHDVWVQQNVSDFESVTFDSSAYVTGTLTGLQSLIVNDSATVTSLNLGEDVSLVDGPGTLVISQSLTWEGGDMSGEGITRIASGASLLISGETNHQLIQRTLENYGSATWQSAGTLTMKDGATTLNQMGSTWLLTDDASIQNDGSQTAFLNFGILDLKTNSLSLEGNFDSTGTLSTTILGTPASGNLVHRVLMSAALTSAIR